MFDTLNETLPYRSPAAGGGGVRCEVAVVIASVGRPEVLHDTILSLLGQTLRPIEIVVSVPGMEHVDPRTPSLPSVRCIESPKGSCIQRNRGVRALAASVDIVAFFDDDVELDPRFLEVMADEFVRHPGLMAANGQLIADGGPSQRFSRDDARAMLAEFARSRPIEKDRWLIDSGRIHGCHFVVRRCVFGQLQFDERMPLYGWLEDVDFGRACRKLGRVGCVGGARVVHLAHRGGRTSGLRFGFSQVMNPAYLRSKGNYSLRECFKNWRLALASNVAGTLMLNRTKRERLVGNMMAFGLLVRGRIDPERITRL